MTAIDVDDVLNVLKLVTMEGAADIKTENVKKDLFFPYETKSQR